jgi:UPF0176 protein
MALAAANSVVELREVLLKDKPADLTAVSPKATVPVLVLPDGQILEESLDIIDWALNQSDPLHWANGRNERNRLDSALRWRIKNVARSLQICGSIP